MNEQDKNATKRITHNIPASLEHLRDALPLALMYLARGERAKSIPEGPIKKVNFKITSRTEEFISRLTHDEFGTRTQTITQALAWVAERNEREIFMLMNTKI